MPLTWNEIRDRAFTFAHEWKDETREDSEAKSFWDNFFEVFGVARRRFATFEKRVKRADGTYGFIDAFWPGVILVEHKSRGEDLDKAFKQAKEYIPGIDDDQLPKFIVLSDFGQFRVYDLDTAKDYAFSLQQFPDYIKLFGFIAGYTTTEIKSEDAVNINAAERMAKLHDRLKDIGYTGDDLELYLVRLLFCLFAEDTTLFEKATFNDFIRLYTREDGSDLAAQLGHLFQVLDTPYDRRLKTLPDYLAAFPYVNGDLFNRRLPMAGFDATMRKTLEHCSGLDWAKISPAIFGSLFQGVMNPLRRRNLGAHYTSESNILKVIGPLFLDDLVEEFNAIKKNKNQLRSFHEKLAKLTFLDPACGCGNFLIVTYKELRLLELQVLQALYGSGQTVLNVAELVKVGVTQFNGIEVEEFPARVAEVAMWLIDHQMNLAVSQAFGQYFARLPLKQAANIVHANALQIDWKSVMPHKADGSEQFLLGNPPYGGKQQQSAAQKIDLHRITSGLKRNKELDFVGAWFLLASNYLQGNKTKCALVATNSVSQGEQVAVLWGKLLSQSIHINFAHRPFKWTNEARGKAAVHCVIIGMSTDDSGSKTLYDYGTAVSEPNAIKVSNINPYLFQGSDTLISNRTKPLCSVPKLNFGSMPNDDGNYIFTEAEKTEFLKQEPNAANLFRQFTGAKEFLNGNMRWCLWLADIEADVLQKLPHVLQRVDSVRKFRSKSTAVHTRRSGQTPKLFFHNSQPSGDYLLVPSATSIRRSYIPIAFVSPAIIASNLVLTMANATHHHFGVLSSLMHMTWVRYICGRLKSDYRYSTTLVYNNFPWPEDVTADQLTQITKAAKHVLETRTKHATTSLANLYDPRIMPADLRKAHNLLDRAVDKAYRSQPFPNELSRIEFLFQRYVKLVTPLIPASHTKSSRTRVHKKSSTKSAQES